MTTERAARGISNAIVTTMRERHMLFLALLLQLLAKAIMLHVLSACKHDENPISRRTHDRDNIKSSDLKL